MTKKPEKYFKELTEKINATYKVAEVARSKNKDPETYVEAVPAGDLAARVEGLVGPKGIAEEIKKTGRENITEIIDAILDGKFGMDLEERIEQAVRTTLAILTEGVVAAPIEGIAKVEKNKNPDNTNFLSVYFSGPIRSAGGTAQGLAVLIAAYIQKRLKYEGFRPTEDIIERYIEEIRLYNDTVTNLQYVPGDEEIRIIVKNSGVCIDGEPTEKDKEVAVHRDISGVHTNQIRGGMCLVIAEGMAQKAPKLMKKASDFGIDWNWLSEVEKLKIGKKGKETDEEKEGIKPIAKFMKETVGGRPIFAAPSAKGAFRLRYGRSRASGIAAKSIHPATQVLLGEFIATGTQIRVERPGKGCIITPCDKIEGPTVKLKTGDVVRVETVEYAKKIKNKISEILFLGDILVSYGDFLQSNHPLVPSGYCEEWWILELKNAGGKFHGIPTPPEAVEISKKFNIPLYPRYTYHWEDISFDELKILVYWFSSGELSNGVMKVVNEKCAKRILELLGIPHTVSDNFIIIEEYIIIKNLFENIESVIKIENDNDNDNDNNNYNSAFEFLNKNSKIKIRKRVGTYIGARMGRPEKAKERKMQPAVHSLFPIGDSGGRERSLNVASDKETITLQVPRYDCSCGAVNVFTECSECGKITNLRKICPNQECGRIWSSEKTICPSCKTNLRPYGNRDVDIRKLWLNAVKNVNTSTKVKGVKGMISAYKIPEHIEKGILRAKNNVFVFKDGTVRFDATDAPLTHFKPKEIGVEIVYLNKLGYKRDYNNNELVDENQILELNVQDIIIPINGAEYFIRTAKFIDDLLSKFYGVENFYNIQTKEELLGHLVVGLAPHTSAGIIGRIIGFTQARVCYAHPYWHAAKRRNCDGDEDTIMLLMDVILNFSKKFLPESRGGKMDAPLVITTLLDPKEVDDEAHKMEIVDHYPLKFYEKTQEYANPAGADVKMVNNILDDNPYSNLKFTHENGNITGPVVKSKYVQLKTMQEKVDAQLSIAEKVRAIDERKVAEILINSHFLRDTYGNLRAFSRQKFRCVKCNQSYRRVPLVGKCTKCGGRILLTVTEGSVRKYLDISKDMAEKYHLSDYLKQRLVLLDRDIKSLFTNDLSKQVSLSDFM